MSDNLPPQPPQPPPGGQWEHGPGEPVPTQPVARGGAKRAALAGGGLLLVGALVGGGIVGYNLMSDDSPLLAADQPSQALPATTLAYAAIDLDPSGKQKIEAIRTLRKFPAFTDEVDLKEDADVRKRIFELAQEDAEECTELDFDEDIDSWLGERFAVAAVGNGDDVPFPVGVVQVEGEDETRAGLAKIEECAEDEPEEFGLAFVDDEWAIVTETQAQADQVVAGVEEGTLRDDEDFQTWGKAVGEAGPIHLYAAPALGKALIDHGDEIFGSDFAAGFAQGFAMSTGTEIPEDGELPEELRSTFEDFPGAAGTIRFSNGALEAEFVSAGKAGSFQGITPSAAGAAVVATLPDTTAAAFGFGLGEGWLDLVLDQLEPMLEGELGMTPDEALEELERSTGLTGADVEALLGDSFALAVDSDLDPDAFAGMPDPSRLPVGVKIQGDTEKIEAVLDKLRKTAGPEADRFLLSRTVGDHVVVAMSADYLDKLAEKDGLGDEAGYEALVGDGDPTSVLYVSFDAGDDWLDRLVAELGAPAGFRENVAPLSGIGVSSWIDDDIGHILLRIATD